MSPTRFVQRDYKAISWQRVSCRADTSRAARITAREVPIRVVPRAQSGPRRECQTFCVWRVDGGVVGVVRRGYNACAPDMRRAPLIETLAGRDRMPEANP